MWPPLTHIEWALPSEGVADLAGDHVATDMVSASSIAGPSVVGYGAFHDSGAAMPAVEAPVLSRVLPSVARARPAAHVRVGGRGAEADLGQVFDDLPGEAYKVCASGFGHGNEALGSRVVVQFALDLAVAVARKHVAAHERVRLQPRKALPVAGWQVGKCEERQLAVAVGGQFVLVQDAAGDALIVQSKDERVVVDDRRPARTRRATVGGVASSTSRGADRVPRSSRRVREPSGIASDGRGSR